MNMASSAASHKLMAGLVLAIILSAPAAAQETSPSAVADLVIQVQELQHEVRTLRGMLRRRAIWA